MREEAPFSHGTFLIDIGSHSIAAAHISRNEHGLVVRGAVRRELTRQQLDDAALQKRIAEHFPRLLADMRDVHGSAGEVVVCINGIFTVSQTRTEDVAQMGVVTVTPETLRPAIQAGITNFFKEVLGDERNEFMPLDTALLATRLNGYEVADPFGKRAKKVGVTIHVAVASRPFHAMLRRSVARVLPHASLMMHATTYGIFRGLGEAITAGDWLFIDTTGGITELGFVEDGLLRHVISLPDGGHALAGRVARVVGADVATVQSDLSLLARGVLESKKAAALRGQVQVIAREFAIHVVDALDKPTGHPQLPATVVLVAHPWTRSIVRAMCEDPVYIRATIGGVPPQIIVVDQPWLTEQGVYCEEGSRDVFLCLLALGVSHFKSGGVVL